MYLTFGIEFLHAAGETAPLVAVVGRRIVSSSTIVGRRNGLSLIDAERRNLSSLIIVIGVV
jgi:hypothetical protein